MQWECQLRYHNFTPLDTGRKLNVQKAFTRRPGHLQNALCTFSLRLCSEGKKCDHDYVIICEYILIPHFNTVVTVLSYFNNAVTGVMVMWLSLMHNFIRPIKNSTQVQILLII